MSQPDLIRAHQLLIGPRARDIVRAGLTQLEGDPGDIDVTVERVYYRPDAEATVGYRVHRTDRDQFIVVTTAPVGLDVAKVDLDGITFTLWRHPADPKLPGLVEASDPRIVTEWLAFAGVPVAAGEMVKLRLLSYRPLRRAVLRASLGERHWFIKLGRRKAFGMLSRRQHLLADAGLGPAVVAEPAPSVLLMAAAPGRPLTQVLADFERGAGPVPESAEFVSLLDALPREVAGLRLRPSWSDRADFHGAAAANRLPDRAAEIGLLADRVAELTASTRGEPVPTHGDFYEANIFVENNHPVCLIDVDSIGPGQRADDLACLLAHLAVLPDLSKGRYRRTPQVVARWADVFEQTVDPLALRVRVAGVLLTLVAGTTPTHAEVRLNLALEWALKAEQALG